MGLEQGLEYKYEILASPTFSYLRLLLEPGQKIQCERGTMLYFSPSLEISTQKAQKGLFKSLKRSLAGETFLLNTFTAVNQGGMLGLAPSFAGDLKHIPLNQGESWIVFSGGYIASSIGLEQNTQFQGMKKSFFSGENAFMLLISAPNGPGDLFVGANGAFIEWNMSPGQKLMVDNGHLVAMESSVQYDIKKVGGWKSTILSGEGVVVELTGPGKVLLQSRNPIEFAEWLQKLLPAQSSSSGSGGFSLKLG